MLAHFATTEHFGVSILANQCCGKLTPKHHKSKVRTLHTMSVAWRMLGFGDCYAMYLKDKTPPQVYGCDFCWFGFKICWILNKNHRGCVGFGCCHGCLMRAIHGHQLDSHNPHFEHGGISCSLGVDGLNKKFYRQAYLIKPINKNTQTEV